MSKKASKRRETISAAIPAWKKRLVESVRDKRGHRFISQTLEEALDEMLSREGVLPKKRSAA